MNAQTATIIPTAPPTQNERLLIYLKSNTEIDPLTAWRELGIYRLGARVWDLRASGHEITSGRKTIKNRYDEDCSVASYRLIPTGDLGVANQFLHAIDGSICEPLGGE